VLSAAPQEQWRLLDVQDHDTRLAQIAHRVATLPEHAEIERLRTRLGTFASELVVARTRADDLARELTKAEADVEQVRQRAARDRARLEAGQGSAKDLLSMQHELQTLAQRQNVLEDAELEVMERQETAATELARLVAEHERVQAELAELESRRDEQIAGLDAEAATVSQAREQAAAGLPGDLLALYERVRANAGGVGAARLSRRRCEGCRLELNATDLGRIRVAADDAVIRCEECGRILVRTAESGL
jgi:predicted  nucleic acid-binding Zn-ribbon protein